MNKFAYAAGLFDAEGSVTLEKNGGPLGLRRPVLTVGTTDFEGPQRMQEIFGGALRLYSARDQTRQDQLRWQRYGNACLPVMEEMLPYLQITRRRRIFELLLSSYPWAKPGGPMGGGHERAARTEKIFQDMRKINSQRGKGIAQQLFPVVTAPTEAQASYIAGVLDGEGWVSSKQARVEVFSTDPELIDWLQQSVGGHTYVSPASKSSSRRQTYSWRVRSQKDVEKIFEPVVELLAVPRKKEALSAWIG